MLYLEILREPYVEAHTQTESEKENSPGYKI